MYRIHVASVFLVVLLASCRQDVGQAELKKYYPPTIYSDTQYLSISIPVEISEKGGRPSFVHLFEKYGFSGNGPAIEQVVRANLTASGEYDSEGDAFYVRAKKRGEYDYILTELRCIEDIECLNKWLDNASTILFKE